MRRTEFTRILPKNEATNVLKKQSSNGGLLKHVIRTFLPLILAFMWGLNANAQSCTLVCNDDAQVSLPGTDYDCEAVITPDMVLESPRQSCPGPKTVTIYDLNGNPLPQQNLGGGNIGTLVDETYIGLTLTVLVTHQATGNWCDGAITIEDKQGPNITGCDADTLYCLQDPKPIFEGGDAKTPSFDDCSGAANLTIVYHDAITNGTCTDTFSQIITRTWTATDPGGMASTCTQRITLNKVSLSDPLVNPVCPDPVDLECNSFFPPSVDPSVTGYPTITLDGVKYDVAPGAGFACEIAASYSDEQFDLCGGAYKILRTWTIYDWCLPTAPGLNPYTCIQVIKLLDTEDPIISCPADVTKGTNSASCSANVVLPPANVLDSCSSVSVVTITPVGILNGNGGLALNVPVGTHPITYIATDACGNSASCTGVLHVVDDIAPVNVCEEYKVISLTTDGTALAHAVSFDDGSSDNCGITDYKVRRMPTPCQPVTTFEDYVTFDCCDLGDTIMVTLRVYDGSDNYNDCMIEVWLQDKLPPQISCPPPKQVDCSVHITDYSIFGSATATDNCGTPDITEVVTDSLDQCGVGYIYRTFTATDDNGLTDVCTQTIKVVNNDVFIYDDIEWPEDYTTNECDPSLDPDDLPCAPVNYCRPLLRSNSCGLITVSYTDQLLPVEFPACYKVLRTWVVADWCQFDPNATNPVGYWEYVQVIKVLDETPPVVVCPADTVWHDSFEANCMASNVVIDPMTATDCSPNLDYTIKIDYNNDGVFEDTYAGNDASGAYPIGTHLVHMKVEDGCGNASVCDVIVIVRDAKKPTAVCLNGVSATLMPMNGGGMVVLTPEMFNNSSNDNCTDDADLKLRIDPDTFTCDEIGLNLVTLYVTDQAGNTDYCETFVDIQDNMGVCDSTGSRIAGAIKDVTGQGVQNVKVDLNGGNTLLGSYTTSTDGAYSFDNLVAGYDYSVAPSLDQNITNGVSTYDLVLISKHILNVEDLDSPYKIIAADVNNSNKVSTLDLLALRKVVLRVDNSFPNNASWRFIDKDFIFQDPTDPFATPFSEVVNFNNLTADELDVNFIAVKVGDVNGSAKANSILGVDNRSYADDLLFETQNQTYKAGEMVEVPFTANDFSGIEGFQFTLKFDNQSLELNDIIAGDLTGLSMNNFGLTMVDDGIITSSWDNSKNTLNKSSVLFTLQFRAIADGQLNNALTINSQFTVAEAYKALEANATPQLFNVDLKFNDATVANSAFELYQNQPNPFSQSTMIGFNLPETSIATLTVYDLSGKVLKVYSNKYPKGYNEINIKDGDITAHGVLYYRLETTNNTATRKMVVLK